MQPLFVATAFCLLILNSGTSLSAQENQRPSPQPAAVEIRNEFKNLTPAERRAKIQEIRDRRRQAQERLRKQTPEQLEARKKEREQRLESRLAELRKKKADGTLTPQEKSPLAALEHWKATRQLPATQQNGANPAPSKTGDF
ncbi:MAG: hypothetical protein AB1813_24940 [Verrucomicrobiota bacterium]